MKKINILLLSSLTLSIVFGTILIFNKNINLSQVSAANETDMDSIAVENGEELDKNNIFYDDFSNGIDTSKWVISKKAWGNSSASYNSGVIPENVMYNSSEDIVIFRALGDYYQDNDVNYDLHSKYGVATEDKTGNGRVYSKDGTRTGGCIKTRATYGPGRFEARFKSAPIEGICNAFWTFNYGNSGEEGYNETDFEFPTYLTDADKNDLDFSRVICTTYLTESNYKSQRVTNPTYLNDNEYHTYCLDWYYSQSTKKINWFIDGNLIASYNKNISSYNGRVTLGCWIPGRSSFCGIPNFDKAYMELDYFKYTPFKNQSNVSMDDTLKDYVTTYTTVTSSKENNFIPHGDFNYGIPSSFISTKDVEASKSYDFANSNSYGIKIAGNNGIGTSTFSYTNPNIRGIKKLELSFKYKGYGSLEADGDSSSLYSSGTIASPIEWADFNQIITIPANNKTLQVKFVSESNDYGLYIDNVSLTYPKEEPANPILSGENSYNFFTINNGQSTTNSSIERTLYPDGNNNHPWLINAGKYYASSSDNANTLYFKPDSTVMSSVGGSVYYPIKTCLLDNSFTISDAVAVAMMQFDVDNFTDVNASFYSYSGVGGRKILILYSLDNGTSWHVLHVKTCDDWSKTDAPFRYNFDVSANSASLGKTIRLAFVGSAGTGSSNTDGYRLTSVIINEYENFKQTLQQPLCSLDNDGKIFLGYNYSLLSSSELEVLCNETMNGYNQTYQQGYDYLLSYWSGNSQNAHYIAVWQNKNSLFMVITIFATLSTVGLLFIIFKKKKFIKK